MWHDLAIGERAARNRRRSMRRIAAAEQPGSKRRVSLHLPNQHRAVKLIRNSFQTNVKLNFKFILHQY